MRPLEIAACVVTGHDGTLAPSASGERDPRRALELVVLEALRRPPCGVAFSGGRDSSAVLAVAVHVARREGLPEPIPITKVFPDVPRPRSRAWQERVIDHLRLDDWQRIVIHDELDLLGPLATANLVDHGVVWPPTIHGDRPVIDRVRGGSLIDGEGGDEVLGGDGTPHRAGDDARSLPTLRHASQAGAAPRWRSLPKRLHARRVRDRWSADPLPWLRPVAAAALAAAVGGEERPRRRCRSPRACADPPPARPGARRRATASTSLAPGTSSCRARCCTPTSSTRWRRRAASSASAAARPRCAPSSSDLLPDDVLTRADQGDVQRARSGRPTPERSPSAGTASGVDTSLVDADEVRRGLDRRAAAAERVALVHRRGWRPRAPWLAGSDRWHPSIRDAVTDRRRAKMTIWRRGCRTTVASYLATAARGWAGVPRNGSVSRWTRHANNRSTSWRTTKHLRSSNSARLPTSPRVGAFAATQTAFSSWATSSRGAGSGELTTRSTH